ncbi:MAG: tetratricopeptide repeat protein [Desulfuromonadales bacterium]|nr:tetratricopeptide repeat protein [Desulfuromonadales bacterium]
MMLNYLFNRGLVAVLLILAAGIIVYSNTFNVPFILDDLHSITENSGIQNLNQFYAIPTRTIAYLTLALNYHFGGLEVTGYHLVNLLIHLITALLVYALLRLTFQTPYFRNADPTQNSKLKTQNFIPLFAALLFVTHPIQTQAVTYTVQRLSSLATLFYLLSLVLYIQARLRMASPVVFWEAGESDRTRDPILQRLIPGFFLCGSVMAAVLAMKTKEIAFTLPFAAVLYELFFFHGRWMRRLLSIAPLLLTLPIIPLTVLFTGESSGDLLSDIDQQSRAEPGISRIDYLFTQFRVIATYLRLLVLPIHQNLDYQYPVYTSFVTPAVFLSFSLLVAICGWAVYLYLATPRIPRAWRLVAFGIGWFFLTLSVESSLIPITDVIFEHRLYLPSVGAFAAFATAFFLFADSIRSPAARALGPLAVAAFLVVSLAVATWQRNGVWENELRLWQDVVRKSPEKGRPWNNFGKALEEAGRTSEAAEALRRAIEVDPLYSTAYYNLADLYLVNNYPEAALPLLETAIQIKPDFRKAYVKLGAALIRGKKFREAEIFLNHNLERIEKDAEARFYLGAAYVFLGDKAAAAQELAVVSRLDERLAGDLAGLLAMKKFNHNE